MDRLNDLRNDPSGIVSNPVADLEAGGGMQQHSQYSDPNFMQKFFTQVDEIKTSIKSIKDASNQINELHHRMLLATSTDAERATSAELDGIISRTNSIAKSCKKTLEAISDDTETAKKFNRLQDGEIRIRDNLVKTLSRKFGDNVELYKKRQSEYKEGVKDKVARQVRIVKEDATDEEITEIMRGGGTNELYRNAILTSAADPVREAYEQAKDKYADVTRLEESVMELHQLFLDFALLVDQQGELLDQIEYQVQSACDFIEAGNEDIQVAIDIQKSLRKKYCCLIAIIVTVVGAAVAIPIATS